MNEPFIRIDEIRFAADQAIHMQPGSVLVFVGPNNAGKSQSLRDLRDLCLLDKTAGLVVKSAIVWMERDNNRVREWASEHLRQAADRHSAHLAGLGGGLDEPVIKYWPNLPGGWKPGDLIAQWIHLAGCEQRLALSKPTKSVDYVAKGATHPLHILQRYGAKLRVVSDLVYSVFGKRLFIDDIGEYSEFRWGDTERPSERAADAIAAWRATTQTLADQGDGARSFVACALHVLGVDWSVVLFDEPESFLHPPQARRLGRMFARQMPPHRQAVVATHSADFLRGLLEPGADASKVTIARLSRTGDTTSVHPLDAEAIKSVMNDPAGLFSGLLEGLFHERVIICEAEGDCRFYAALASAMDARWFDCFWVSSSGKHRAVKLAKLLKAMSVPIGVVVDFDVLRERRLIEEFCAVLDISWASIADDWLLLKKRVENEVFVPTIEEVKNSIQRTFERHNTETVLSGDLADEIRTAVKFESSWEALKRTGESGLPRGDAASAWHRLRDTFAERGLYVVPVGELESFVPEIAEKGALWVSKVVEGYDLATSNELRKAREFVRKVLALADSSVENHMNPADGRGISTSPSAAKAAVSSSTTMPTQDLTSEDESDAALPLATPDKIDAAAAHLRSIGNGGDRFRDVLIAISLLLSIGSLVYSFVEPWFH